MLKIKKIIGVLRAHLRYYFWNCVNLFNLHVQRCQIGRNFKSRGRIRILNRGDITVGNEVSVNSSIMANPLGGNVCSIFVALAGAKITIGDRTGISNAVIYARESITIGNDVMIGAGVKIYDNDFHPIDFQDRMQRKTPKAKPVEIGDGAFIGAHTIVLKGVSIGKNSVVGAGSVVTKTIPEGQVWAGNPAKFVRNSDG